MQFAIVFVTVCLVAFSSAEDINEKRAAIIKQCKSDLSAGDDVVNIANQKKEPENEAQKCFLQCVYEKMGLIKDGKLSSEGVDALARAKFGSNEELFTKSKEVFTKCEKEVAAANDTSKCALGGLVRSCLIKNEKPELSFFAKN